ncbi:hypothetical protein K435DRAFT_671690, partial [Dendrothele bispora CBS 962.96]
GDINPGNNLHVSGLSKKVDNRELEAAFAKVGRVQKVSVVYDPHTRESRGFAFVTMETPEEADAAVTALNATDLMGRVLTVTKVGFYFFFFVAPSYDFTHYILSRRRGAVRGPRRLASTTDLKSAVIVCVIYPFFPLSSR